MKCQLTTTLGEKTFPFFPWVNTQWIQYSRLQSKLFKLGTIKLSLIDINFSSSQVHGSPNCPSWYPLSHTSSQNISILVHNFHFVCSNGSPGSLALVRCALVIRDKCNLADLTYLRQRKVGKGKGKQRQGEKLREKEEGKKVGCKGKVESCKVNFTQTNTRG